MFKPQFIPRPSPRIRRTNPQCKLSVPCRPTSNKPRLYSTTTSSPHPSPTPSVDPTQLTHFNALASSWWDPHGPSRLLHLMNPLRHTFISSCLATSQPRLPDNDNRQQESPPHNLKYLDIGCGGGIFAESAARLPTTASVTAIDPSSEVLAVARTHARRDPLLRPPRLAYRQSTIEDLTASEGLKGTFDILTLFEVLEHVPHPSSFLAHAETLVKPGGWLVLSTISRTLTSFLTTKVMAEGVLGIVPWGTHEWGRYLKVEELWGWFEGRGGVWERPRARGVIYVPGFGWREVGGGERWGNYFLGVRKREG